MPCHFFTTLLLSSSAQNAQTVKGSVTSKGQPVNGATVNVKGGTTSTLTDSSGNFSITTSLESILEISHVSFLKKKFH
ncbi:carboxypeptidase-like regulatory domain-containing protein [Niabella ginsengisoli]|uniref:Carboxypeptidase-like regulatory domain-containing protein n=1 Tax=Niabella ginsengisoli TaxID=522298 RepID=A0ABS9SJG2_9BACT|nr:carboxypeptidase-like regulatory domain-containing protein [Niabella ginsengisoli]MCH5598522.1 carboxypeptidase-like regulatory domain-containing protein [Niabella ginsengisoli]